MKIIHCPDTSENSFVSFFVNIKNKSFRFTFKWVDDICYLSIFDNLGEPVNTGNALMVNEIIVNDNRILPNLLFICSEDSTIPPAPETLKDYVIAYTSE